jgi:protein-disulfide isomerase
LRLWLRRSIAGGLVAAALVSAVFLGRQGGWSVPLRVPAYRQKGPAGAPVVLVEYSDFQCPSCAKVQPYLRELLARQGDRVRFVFRHHPLNMHKWAIDAARAAECAGRQGRFWEYHDALFAKQAEWSRSPDPAPLFLEYARELGLDVERFRRETADRRWDGLIVNDRLDALAMDVTGTPTFFVNRRRAVGESQLRANGERFIVLEDAR